MIADRSKQHFRAVCFFLTLVTAALYWPITHHPFIMFDDVDYVTGNPSVNSGLSWANFVWAFNGAHAANWHPLTWLSHQLDCTLFGLNAGRHHLGNLLLHTINSLLVLVFLRTATGSLWRSAVVAALFAWHPLHVESVAWASERKDTLSTFFWLLTLLAYVKCDACRVMRETESGSSRITHHASFWYFAALLFFALGVMSKPMVVTLPFVLLLLDVWPLDRISTARKVSLPSLIIEKIPFFALATMGCATTYLSQTAAMSSISFSERLGNAVLAYASYVVKFFWPDNLAIVYSHAKHTPWLLALGALALLLLWTIPLLLNWRRRPWLVVGWLWFLGTLVPTIGLVQVGAQSMADRYTYIPSVGFFIVVVWGAAEFFSSQVHVKYFGAAIAGVALLGCVVLTTKQITYWRDSITLFRHAYEVTPDNYVAANSLGKAYELAGDNARALYLYRAAVEMEPRFPVSQFNLAMTLLEKGDDAGGLEHLQIAAQLQPENPDIHFDLGVYYSSHSNWVGAAQSFSNAVALRPPFATAHASLARALTELGHFPAAAAQYREALRLEPQNDAAQSGWKKLSGAHPELP